MIRACLLLLCTLLAPFAVSAAEPFEAGKHYFLVEPVQPTASHDKIEVIEAFSYGCVHCWEFQPKVDAWKKRMPANVTFAYLPATFRSDFALFARGYYAAEALGVAERTHQAVFEQVFSKKAPAHTLAELAQLYATLGVDAADFTAAANSFAVQTRLKRVDAMLPRYGIDGTPTMIVAGKYRVTGLSAGGYEKVFDVVDFLIAKESAPH